MFEELVKNARSVRNFDSTSPLGREDLLYLVNLCRFTPSTANRQPMKFAIAYTQEDCAEVFPLLKWAGYLEDKPPYDGNVPAGYILLCCDRDIMQEAPTDCGICAQTIVLGAAEKGIAACMLGAFSKEEMRSLFSLADNLEPVLIIALGKAKEKVEITDATEETGIRYYRSARYTHVVPKRPLEEIFIGEIKEK